MAVAEAFKLRTVRNLERIDASALYLLARDDVPEAARQEAVEREEAGERLRKIVEFAIANSTFETKTLDQVAAEAVQRGPLVRLVVSASARLSSVFKPAQHFQ